MKTKFAITLAALALSFGAFALLYSTLQESLSAPLPKAVAQAQASSVVSHLDDDWTKVSAPSTEISVAPPQAAVRKRVAASTELKAIFPGVTEANDWPRFNSTSKTITIAPYPDMPMTFTCDSVKQDGKFTTWIGRNASMPGSSLVTEATDHSYDAVLVIPGSHQFSYHVSSTGVVAVIETNPGQEYCGVGAQPLLNSEADEEAPITAASITIDGKDSTLLALADTSSAPKVDVLFLYDTDALAAAQATSGDGVAYIEGQSKALIDTSNIAVNQSGVTSFVWHFIGINPAPVYTKTDDLGDDLTAMTSGTSGSAVTTLRSSFGADQIVLWRGKHLTTNVVGMAFSSPGATVSARSACAAVIWGYSYHVVAHELAHNFGCQHDRATDEVKDGDGHYYYGQMWTPSAAAPTHTIGTIMSYAASVIPFFSNPAISAHVTSAGTDYAWFNIDLGTIPVGVADTAPRAADNAKVLNTNGAVMSALTVTLSAPAITSQPASTSVQVGSSFTLSVTATGGSLSYQWKLGGTAIAGATSSSYSKSAATADAGSYTVVVSNAKGSVTSSAATVTVTAAPVTPDPVTPAPSGGGGGAMSDWFVGALAILSFSRWMRSRR